MRRLWRWFINISCLMAMSWAAAPVQAGGEIRKVRLGIEKRLGERVNYEVSVLALALEHSGHQTELEVVALGDTVQERVLVELEQGHAPFDVFYSGGSKDRETRLRQIDIPLTRGLLGHRVFITRQEELPRLARLQTLEEFRRHTVVASGIGWPDTEIFKAAGFTVEALEWGSIWAMLAAGRFDVFNRGIHEAYPELAEIQDRYPNLAVDTQHLLKYRFGFFFYVSKDNEELAQIIETGLNNAYENGAFMTHFANHPDIANILDFMKRWDPVIFEIDNPLLSERQRAIPDKYWHNF